MNVLIALKKRFLKEREYELSIHRDYVRHWGLQEAVREILQNAIDAGDMKFKVVEVGLGLHTCFISSSGAGLPTSSLLLGMTTKSGDDDTIGQFGEGYKLALLVLTRMNHKPKVHHGNVTWSTRLEMNSIYGVETLRIVETPYEYAFVDGRITFQIDNLTAEDIQAIKNYCLSLQNLAESDYVNTPVGNILLNSPGKLYVGGLYICDTEMKFGYNALPKHAKLERDRKTIGSFNMEWLAALMWAQVYKDRKDEIVKMMAEGYPDVKYLRNHINWQESGTIEDAAYEDFIKKAGAGAIIVDSQEAANLKKAEGHKNVWVASSRSYYEAVCSSGRYVEPNIKEKPKEPHEVLQTWMETYRTQIPEEAVFAMNKIIITAEAHWNHEE